MTLPTTGPLSLLNIYNEKRGRSQSNDEPANDDEHLSLRGLSVDGTSAAARDYIHDGDDRFIDGTPNGTAPYAISEFRGYSQFQWSTSTIYAPTGYFTSQDTSSTSGSAVAGTSILITFNSNNSHTVQFQDFTNSAPGSGGTYSTAQTFSSTSTPNSLQVRWKFFQYDRIISTGADSGDKVEVNFHSANATVFTGTSSSASNQSYQTNWQSCTPFALGGNNANTQSSYIRITCDNGGFINFDQDDRIEINTDLSSQYLGLQLRANSSDSNIITFRNSLSTNAEIIADSFFEEPDFSCIMPDMLVKRKVVIDDIEQHEWTRIGDIVVGDYILAQGDLNDPSVLPQWAEVTEARTHTRSGYWDVYGIHITNDHPVWLTNDTHTADINPFRWVKVEDMRDVIERTYVEGSVDTIYLGTTPGHFYVWNEDQSKALTVSGDYATETD